MCRECQRSGKCYQKCDTCCYCGRDLSALCVDCGAELPAGYREVFTVCEICWDKPRLKAEAIATFKDHLRTIVPEATIKNIDMDGQGIVSVALEFPVEWFRSGSPEVKEHQ